MELCQIQRPAFTVLFGPERFQRVVHRLSEAHPQTVVSDFVEFQVPTRFDAMAFSADQNKRNIVEGVGIALTQFIDPDDESVIQH